MSFHIISQFIAFIYFAECFLVSACDSNEKTICGNKEDCIKCYTPNFEIAQSYNTTVVEEPICSNSTDIPVIGLNSTHGICTCGAYCKSRSISKIDETVFYYCGPCGRIGSECNDAADCSTEISECINGYCDCKSGGTFYDLYFCYVPYHGYEVALQLAVATCIIIAVCLILVSIYNAIGVHRLRRIQALRALLRRDNGNRRTRPEDAPPKYDDVVEDLPTYQDALRMDHDEPEPKGVSNLAFENDDLDSNNSELKVTSSSEGSLTVESEKGDDQLPENQNFTDLSKDESGSWNKEINKENDSTLNHSLSFKESDRTEKYSS